VHYTVCLFCTKIVGHQANTSWFTGNTEDNGALVQWH